MFSHYQFQHFEPSGGNIYLAFDFEFCSQTCSEMMSSLNIKKGEVAIQHLPLCDFVNADETFFSADKSEKYALVVGKSEVLVYADTTRALAYALDSLLQLATNDDGIACGIYLAYPAFKIRGIIEGFYGKPWNMKQRTNAIRTMAKKRMNTYIYGPKDDPYHRDYWRLPYDEMNFSLLKNMVKLCKNNHIDLHYMLAPGLDIRYSNASDIDVIVNKLMQVYKIGVRQFGLLFDDILDDNPEEEFVYPEDKARFTTLAAAHVYVINKVYERLMALDSSIELLACPTQYFGNGDEPYIVEFGQGLPEKCKLYFTGEKICSAKVTSEQARFLKEKTGHAPLYWDNYPVNDMEMVNEFHISPIINRDADLYRYSEGITLNPMEFAQSSLLNLLTFADYMWDSVNYDPVTSYKDSITTIVGEKYIKPFETFNKFLYRSCLLQHGHHYRFMKPTGYHTELVDIINTENYTLLHEYMCETRRDIETLNELPRSFVREFERWYTTALVCCDLFIDVSKNAGKCDFKKEHLPQLLDYLCRAEDVLKYETKLLIYKLNK